MMSLWNNLRIHQMRNAIRPGGRPNVLFLTQQTLGISYCRIRVENSAISLAEEYRKRSSLFGCTYEFLELTSIIIEEKTLLCQKMQQMPKTCMLLLQKKQKFCNNGVTLRE